MPLKTKNAYRTLPLSVDAIDVLMQQRRKTGNSEWVFPSPTGGPMSPDSVLHMLHRVLKRAGLPKVRFHDLRHTFATLALQNGVDIKTVSGMLGHFSAGFTLDTYAHVTTSAKREAAKTMGNTQQEEEADSIEQFILRAKKYPNLQELTPAVLHDLVNRVYVSAPDKSSGQRVQDVHISLACIGFLPESIIAEMLTHAAKSRTA